MEENKSIDSKDQVEQNKELIQQLIQENQAMKTQLQMSDEVAFRIQLLNQMNLITKQLKNIAIQFQTWNKMNNKFNQKSQEKKESQ